MPEQEHTAVQSETPENKVSGKTEDLAETSAEMPGRGPRPSSVTRPRLAG